MNIRISDAVLCLFTEIKVFGVLLDIPDPDSIDSLDFPCAADLDVDGFMDEVAQWQAIYQRFPHPKGARVSIEYIINALLKGKLKSINPVVDAYNYASLLSMCPIGGEDFDRLASSDLLLDVSSGEETFISINKGKLEKTLAGEIVWRSGDTIVCRSMNFVESDLYKITEDTKKVVFLIEQPTASLKGDPLLAISIIKSRLKSAATQAFILDSKSPCIAI